MEVVINVEGVKCSVGRSKGGSETQTFFDLGHKRKEIGVVRAVERLGAFSEDEFADACHLGHHHTGGIAPEKLVADLIRGWMALFGGRLVAAPLASQFTVFVASRLLPIAQLLLLKISFGIVLLDPGNDMLGVNGDDTTEVLVKIVLERKNLSVQQRLKQLVGEESEFLGEVIL